MKTSPFNPETDLPPTPFDERHCRLAVTLKDAGLPWKPHVGCFIWDRDELIEVGSPFPGRIYFILNLGHFLRRFIKTVENIQKRLVWLPTWHQARLLCAQFRVHQKDVSEIWASAGEMKAGDELIGLYEILLRALRKGRFST